MVRRNLPRATSDLLELAGHNKLGWRLGGKFGGLTVTPARRQTPPEWMSFHYLVRAKQWPRMRHTHFHRVLADAMVPFPF
jgi:hypothetical protein